LKYHYRRSLGPPLGQYLARYLEGDPFGRVAFDLIVPIPLHSRREFEREFNQATLIANEVSQTLSLPMEDRCVQRIKATRPQVGLNAEERAANLRGAFIITERSMVQGRTILLIDDVATTLSTGNSCAESLLEAGASQVYLATVARDL
jgi:ComF family protein